MESTYPPIGTVSEGTTRFEDLIPAFMDVLRHYAPESAQEIEESSDGAPVFSALEEDDFDGFWISNLEEEAAVIVDALFDALAEIAAPFCYFGSTDGDGADYGYWPGIENLSEAARYGDGVLKVNAGDEWPCTSDGRRANGESIDYVMAVSDHGNVTLYDSRARAEIWSIV